MKVVILAGGPGTRLWPLSNPDRSKAFQPVIRGQSMLQYTYRQLSRIIPGQNLYIQAPEGLELTIYEQLPEVDAKHVILNPVPRDTLSIVLWVVNELGGDPDEPLLIKCVDQFIGDEDVETFVASLAACIKRYDRTSLTPTLLCTEYRSFHSNNGYALADDSKNITTFIEKPTRKTVEDLATKGAVYSSPFMFITSKNALLRALEGLNYPWADMSRQLLQATGKERTQLFLEMEPLSISHTIFQTSQKLKLDIIDFDFLDVGTYEALYQLNAKDLHGNVVIGPVIVGQNCHHNFIVNQNAEPLVVESIHDSVVAQTAAGSLVISMKEADRIKEIYNQLYLK